jgi:hypothetical protein
LEERAVKRCIVLFLALAASLCAGCAYRLGDSEATLDKKYEQAPDLRAHDLTATRAESAVVVLGVEQYYAKGSPYRERMQKVAQHVPYHFGKEMGNFGVGVASVAAIPITLPVFLLSRRPVGDYWAHLVSISHCLNPARATPPCDACAFPSGVVSKPIGEPTLSDEKALADEVVMPLVNAKVAVEIDDPRVKYSEILTTNEKGEIVVDLKERVAQIQPGEMTLKVKVRYEEKEAECEVVMYVRPG